MKTKKTLLVFLILTMLFSSFSAHILAESDDDLQFNTSLETESGELKVGDVFTVTLRIIEITNKTGFIGVNLRVSYDPKYLSIVHSASETDISELSDTVPVVTFGEIHLPEVWTGNPEKFQNILFDEDGEETGTAVYLCTADLNEDLLKSSFTGDDFYVTIPFKCIAPCDSTAIRVPTDGNLSCTQIDSQNNVFECMGQGSELVISGVEAVPGTDVPTEPAEENNIWLYILIAAGALLLVAAVVTFTLIKRKKS